MDQVRQRYVTFVCEFYLNADDGDPTPDEVDNIRQPVADEFSSLPPTTQRSISGTVNAITALEDQILETCETDIAEMHDDLCYRWDALSTEQQEGSRNEVNTAFNTLLAQCRQQKALIENGIITYGELILWQQSMVTRLGICDQRIADLMSRKDEYLTFSQTEGDKIRSRWESIPDDIYHLGKQQVLPPLTGITTESLSDAMGSVPPKSSSLFRFARQALTGGSWRFAKLGQGGQGSVSLYEYFSVDGTVLDRMVVKDSVIENEDRFRNPSLWHGNTTNPSFGPQDAVPLEFHTQKLMSDAPRSDTYNTVRIQGCPQVTWAQRKIRLYMEYASFGDLEQLIDDQLESIPEAFLWFVLGGLLNNAMIMRRGSIHGLPKDCWSEIVHCDLKSPNVFLGHPRSDFFPSFPTPMLGDFGYAIVTNENDALNPTFYNERGTEGYLAPEQLHYMDSITKAPMNEHKILSPCNIYGIGLVMFELIEQKKLLGQQREFLDDDPLEDILEFTDDARDHYSEDLIDTVAQCLSVDPDDRPTVEILHADVQNRLWGDEYKDMREAGAPDPSGDSLIVPGSKTNFQWASVEDDLDTEMENN